MGCAEVISLDEVRARKPWTTLRQRLHERFDRWLDRLESALPEGEPTLGQVSETIGALRQQLTGGMAETIVHHMQQEAQRRPHRPCPTCARLLPARGPGPRWVETMVGAVELERPYFSCRGCRAGTYPLDAVLGVQAGRIQHAVPQAAVALVTEVPYETASTLFGRLRGITVSRERMHAFTHQVAEGRSVVEVAPSREEIARRDRSRLAVGAVPCWAWGVMEPMCRRALRVRADVARGTRATGRDGHDGTTSGAKRQGVASPCLMASALSMCSVGSRCTMNRGWARLGSRCKTRV